MVLMAERMESMPAPSLRRLAKAQPPLYPDSSHIGTRITTRQFYKVTYKKRGEGSVLGTVNRNIRLTATALRNKDTTKGTL